MILMINDHCSSVIVDDDVYDLCSSLVLVKNQEVIGPPAVSVTTADVFATIEAKVDLFIFLLYIHCKDYN